MFVHVVSAREFCAVRLPVCGSVAAPVWLGLEVQCSSRGLMEMNGWRNAGKRFVSASSVLIRRWDPPLAPF